MKTVSLAFAIAILFPYKVFAAEEKNICSQWGINIWGFSYHTNRRNKNGDKYNEFNFGGGIICFIEEKPRGMGNDKSVKLFLSADAIKNSYEGLLSMITLGVEQEAVAFSGGGKIFVMGILTLAYYEDRVNKENQIMFGPAPGISYGYKKIRVNFVFIPKEDRSYLKAVAGSATYLIPPANNKSSSNGAFYQLAIGNNEVSAIAAYSF